MKLDIQQKVGIAEGTEFYLKPGQIQKKDLPLKSFLTTFETKLNEPKMDKDIIKVINKQGDKQKHSSNVKAQMTEWIMNDKPGFDLLAKYISNMAKEVSLLQYNRKILPNITDMWGMKYKSEEYAVPHDHWPAIWSCVYYVNAPKEAPGLFFPEMGEQGGERQLEQGLLVMFPGHTKHGVRPKKFKGYRYVVSANINDINRINRRSNDKINKST
tara:strand:- start:5056 stop:5697 length:642 start_codon:yes stop_codon:yes gene_type:complete